MEKEPSTQDAAGQSCEIPIVKLEVCVMGKELNTAMQTFENEMQQLEKEACETMKEFKNILNSRKQKDEKPRSVQELVPEKSKLIKEVDGQKFFEFKFNFSEFKADQVKTEVAGGKVLIIGRVLDSTDDREFRKELTQEIPLPPNVDPETIQLSLSEDGVLTVTIPIPEDKPAPPPEPAKKKKK